MRCMNCYLQGYCSKEFSFIVSDEEMTADFLADAKEFLRNENISPYNWRDQITNIYRDYKGRILDKEGNEVFLDTELFEVEHFREWIRDFMRPAIGRPIRIRSESRERIRVLTSILRAAYPMQASYWGIRAANDN